MARRLGGSPVNATGEPPSQSSDNTLFNTDPVFCSLAEGWNVKKRYGGKTWPETKKLQRAKLDVCSQKKLAIPAVYYYSRYMLTFFEEIKYRPLVFLHIKLS